MRLFIGAPLPRDPRLTQVTHALREQVPDLKPVPPGTWHVTLRFLGEVADPSPVEDALHRAVAGHAVMPVDVRGLGAFQGPRRARIVWARVHAEGLAPLAAAVGTATQDIGEPPREAFVAHATLGRLPQPRDLSAFIEAHPGQLAAGVLDRVVLYRSVLGPRGPAYHALAEAPLTARP